MKLLSIFAVFYTAVACFAMGVCTLRCTNLLGHIVGMLFMAALAIFILLEIRRAQNCAKVFEGIQ